MTVESTPKFSFDIQGRIRNVSLPPSQLNSLIPLFECISNSIHATESRFGNSSPVLGRIVISLVRRGNLDSPITGIHISDNGVGLNSENMESFCKSDSNHKAARGGKGVGRLTWLKAFSRAHVDSFYMADDKIYQRSFNFLVGTDNLIQDHSNSVFNEKEGEFTIGTSVFLDGFLDGYEAYCPRKSETIVAKIVGHFLSYLITGQMPSIIVNDGENQINVKDYFKENQTKSDSKSIKFQEGNVDALLSIHHVLINKKLKSIDKGNHWVFYAGNNRVVSMQPIDGQIGLKLVGEDGDSVYVGLCSSEFLDGHVNQERTGFSFDGDISDSIHKIVVDSAKEFLGEYIEKVRDLQLERTSKIIMANPQFLPFRDDLKSFVSSKLTLNTQDEEGIFLELSRQKLRNKRRMSQELKNISSAAVLEDVQDKVQKVADALNDDLKSTLAEYVVRRKEIIEILDSSIAYSDPGEKRYMREDLVHQIICPMRSSSDLLGYDDHNLWLLDDRLAFYTFFQSDKPFKTYVNESDSTKEPDIAVMFDRSLAFHREGKDEPIIIVEFKRPGRNDYSASDNPIVQVLNYVDEFRSGKSIVNYAGKHIRPLGNGTRFICYIVADITETLRRVATVTAIQHQTADGEGIFGYSPHHNAYVEVVPYHKVVADSKVRNEAFFSKLGLN